MYRLFVAFAVLTVLIGGGVATDAFASGDETVDGVYLNPANSSNGDAYAEVGPAGQLKVELTGLNPDATTTVDDVFTISTTNNRSRIWIEHDATSAVSIYRSDTGTSIDSKGDRLLLRDGETVPVGIRIEAGSETVILTAITVRGEVEPLGTTSPSSQTTQPPTTPITTEPTATQLSTTAPPTTKPPTTTQSTTTEPLTAEPGTTVSTDDNRSTPTPSEIPSTRSPTLTPGTPTETARTPTPTSAPAGTTDPGAPDTAEPTDTDDDTLEIGGLAPLQLLGLLAALALIPAAVAAYRWLSGPPLLTVATGSSDGLRVSAGDHDPDYYVKNDDEAVSFTFTRNEIWESRERGSAVSFDGVVDLENSSDDPLIVTPRGENDVLGSIRLLAGDGGDAFPADGLRMEPGDRVSLSVAFPEDFEPAGDVSVFFDGDPPAE